jgi:alkanesulfonate monooxygenase SsuD/methylene tetrahydromethanopterin reductase-like flavin-dependent oxidoreductase (luciferase family)
MLKGRAAWNNVTALYRAEAANFGSDEHMGHDVCYDRADEFMEVVLGHWNTWEDDALILVVYSTSLRRVRTGGGEHTGSL